MKKYLNMELGRKTTVVYRRQEDKLEDNWLGNCIISDEDENKKDIEC